MSLFAAESLLSASERVTRIARADFRTVREQPWNPEAGASMTEMAKRRGRLALCLVLMSEVEEERDAKTREPSFLSALAFLDSEYATNTTPNDPHWDDPYERRAHEAHAESFGWRRPGELS